ncbi:DNA repair exonuclease SbcCD nuclease subunit [Nitrosomonas oligotropha]|jgi:DNA repair exonuclease SbcCD nuclease subunit|uniref:DNA repair exonuclease SbcCD nuclease subunit n=1 Tax=Nitrosomonas oligotropha TaxID=42354 RepID=A0A2T5HXT2_9PROT|nr:DNA repair exonuclease [Nitrosomonas oligotropha]PTQ76395.1 DNA repair exonuclease SbcCD nuclease subunit [Nitrosomonas oligotropha]
MKFIHTADIHLDSPLVGLAAYQDAPVQQLRTVTRDAFSRLVDAAIEEEVDFMVIAGDLYDGSWKDYNTGHYFCREMGRLNKAKIPVYLLYGNHDSESEMTKKLSLPSNVNVFESRKPSTYRIETLKVALHGRSYREAATFENLASSYPEPIAGWLNIGVLHTALGGYAAHQPYAPCSLDELTVKGYDYWALGHVHEHAILQKDPWIVYPGNLQGRHIREIGERGAVLVTADETGIQSVERLCVDMLRWYVVDVDASVAATLQEVASLAGRAIEQLIFEVTVPMHLALRVRIIGKTTTHGELFGLETQLREEILGQVASQGADRIWVEKVKIETESSVGSLNINTRSDAISELQGFLDEIDEDKQFHEFLLSELKPLADRAPLDLIRAVPELNYIRSGDIESIVKTIKSGLMDYLRTGAE